VPPLIPNVTVFPYATFFSTILPSSQLAQDPCAVFPTIHGQRAVDCCAIAILSVQRDSNIIAVLWNIKCFNHLMLLFPLWPGWPSWRRDAPDCLGLGGLTVSEDGGLEELEESFDSSAMRLLYICSRIDVNSYPQAIYYSCYRTNTARCLKKQIYFTSLNIITKLQPVLLAHRLLSLHQQAFYFRCRITGPEKKPSL